jgi:AcrR family transcriptional regulator
MSESARKREQATREPSSAYSKRRREMITAAAEVFRSRGLSNTSINDISSKLGVDRASLYYYFSSKHALFRAVILESVERIVGRSRLIAEGSTNAEHKVTDLISLVAASFEQEYPSLHVYLQEDMRRHVDQDTESARLASLADDYMSHLQSVIASGMETGEFRKIQDPVLVALIVQGAVNWMHRWFIPETASWTPQEIAAAMSEVLLYGLAETADVAPASRRKRGQTPISVR